MINHTNFRVDPLLINQALLSLPDIDFRLSLNEPTGDFFYDPWQIKNEFKGTVWEAILNTLPIHFGEARIIRLQGANSYFSHADIDNRYHLNLDGNKCYLIDLDNEIMHPVISDGIWYDMDAGRRHSAANFGNRPRHQLVVRHLLTPGKIINPIDITIITEQNVDPEDARFIFDDVLSPWLNNINKRQLLKNFKHTGNAVSFTIPENMFLELKNILPKEFEIK